MYPFIKPDYQNSIVNLMSSISYACGKTHKYPKLKDFQLKPPIVLVVIDGLGYDFLRKQKDSFLYKHCVKDISSTFLSTTACANMVFHTGLPPQQTALTGWDIFLKEVGALTTILPYVPKFGTDFLSKYGVNISELLKIPAFDLSSTIIAREMIVNLDFTRYIARNSKIIPTRSYVNTFTKLQKEIKHPKTFTHAYFPELDSLMHEKGTKHKEVKSLFNDIDKRISKLKTKATILVTADHGMIDSKKVLWAEDIPGFKDCLTLPLAGEPRVAYCYVRPAKVRQFLAISKKYSKYWWCYPGEKLIRDNFFGLYKPNKKLFDRVGDYVLIMKDGYQLKDRTINLKRHAHKGVHAGTTHQEMRVPLIRI